MLSGDTPIHFDPDEAAVDDIFLLRGEFVASEDAVEPMASSDREIDTVSLFLQSVDEDLGEAEASAMDEKGSFLFRGLEDD